MQGGCVNVQFIFIDVYGPVKEILCLHDLGFNECFLGSHNYGDCEGQIKSQSTVGVTSG